MYPNNDYIYDASVALEQLTECLLPNNDPIILIFKVNKFIDNLKLSFYTLHSTELNINIPYPIIKPCIAYMANHIQSLQDFMCAYKTKLPVSQCVKTSMDLGTIFLVI